jgi:lysyl-tRNA synthetase class 2
LQADPSLTLHAGDIVVFQCRPGALLELTRLVHHTPCQQLWHNAVIPDPLPQDAFFATHGLVPPLARPNTTLFFPSPTALRLEPLRNKNRAWDRTKQFFTNRGFVCIETPTLVPSGGVETYLHPFATIYQDHQGRSWPLQLPTSPEFALKKVLSETLLSKVFQLSRAYRNHGELSKHHEPEFVMLEWYRTHASLHDLREDTQKLVGTLAQTLGHSALNLPSTPWPVFRVDTLFQNLMGLSLEKLQETPLFYQAA